jgi:preprotein translocase subunit SecG
MTTMDVLRIVLQCLQGLSAVILVAFVLLHSPKGDGISGLGAGQIFSSQKGAESTLNKLTAGFAATFMVVSFILGYYL